MSATAFFIACMVGLLAVLACIAYFYKRDSDLIGVPDTHGDYPHIEPDLIEKALLDAYRRDIEAASRAPFTVPNGNGKGRP
jgi:hypothetical protein